MMPDLILASQSHARKTMLENAGLVFDTRPTDIDEGAIVAVQQEKGASAAKIAGILASEKARVVSADFPDAIVLGSDQVLECDDELFSKAKDSEDARRKLLRLKGRTHKLISAASIVRGGEILWQGDDYAALSMHNFSDAFLDGYCTKAGDALTRSVGAYELEALGVQLFDKIEGDYFTILGFPLLKVLKYLRDEHGVGL